MLEDARAGKFDLIVPLNAVLFVYIMKAKNDGDIYERKEESFI